MFRSSLALLLAALVLTGCGAVEASTPTARSSAPNLPCSLPYGTRVALLSPAPGSNGNAAGSAVVVVASRDLPKTVGIVATDGKGRANPSATLEQTAPPARARAPFAHPVYYRTTAAGLLAHHHYTVALDDVAQNGCAPYAKIAGGARFSTD